jgi:hypothetical protein
MLLCNHHTIRTLHIHVQHAFAHLCALYIPLTLLSLTKLLKVLEDSSHSE